MTGAREGAATELERVLATVLFTDIVDSTRTAAEAGDNTWRRLLDSHDQLAKQMVEKHRGSLIKSTGDGVLATFDGPGRAVRCALAFGAAARQIGLPLRAGLHTGEIEIRGRDIGGIAVHAAARVMAQSPAGRGARVESRHRPRGRRGPEVPRTRISRTQRPSRPLGAVRRDGVNNGSLPSRSGRAAPRTLFCRNKRWKQ